AASRTGSRAPGWRIRRRPPDCDARARRASARTRRGSDCRVVRIVSWLLLTRDAELAHLLLEVLPVHADLFGGLGDVATVTPERVADELPLEGLDHLVFGL